MPVHCSRDFHPNLVADHLVLLMIAVKGLGSVLKRMARSCGLKLENPRIWMWRYYGLSRQSQ